MKPVIMISAVNFTNGGPLSILLDVLYFAEKYLVSDYQVIALVHKSSLFDEKKLRNISFLEYPFSTKSYFNRLYLEYYYFYKLSKKYKPYLWFALHDMTPHVNAEIRVVYCHNPAPFYKLPWSEIKLDIKFFFFNWLYKFLYAFNISKNSYVVVQQDWLREEFVKKFKLNKDNIVVSYPSIPSYTKTCKLQEKKLDAFIFFFPALPRVFKNFETLLTAVAILSSYEGIMPFKVVLTIDGQENKYSKHIVSGYRETKNVEFVGQLTREQVYKYYQMANCLVFPSKLETWGLPITEAKHFDMSLIVPDLPYAHETVGNYEKVAFFKSDDPTDLALKMNSAITGNMGRVDDFQLPEQPFAENWKQLFELFLNSKL